MRKYKLIIIILFGVFIGDKAMAQTKLYLRNSYSAIGAIASSGTGRYGTTSCVSGTHTYIFRTLSTSQGAAVHTVSFNPSNGSTAPCEIQTQTADGGEFLYFLSPPISSSVTISTGPTYNGYCNESAANLNGGFRFNVYRWTPNRGIQELVATSNNSGECNVGSATLFSPTNASLTATTFQVGDRILVVPELIGAGGGFNGGGGKVFTFYYNDTAVNNGDTWVNFSETISFSADTNNSQNGQMD